QCDRFDCVRQRLCQYPLTLARRIWADASLNWSFERPLKRLLYLGEYLGVLTYISWFSPETAMESLSHGNNCIKETEVSFFKFGGGFRYYGRSGTYLS